MPASSCEISDHVAQPPASGAPGNIGVVNAQVLIWDHDPMLTRPDQHRSFGFKGADPKMSDWPTSQADIQYILNNAHLTPLYNLHDMFLATRRPPGFDGPSGFTNPNGRTVTEINPALDILGSNECGGAGSEAQARLPGGSEYEAPEPFNSSGEAVSDLVDGEQVARDQYTGMTIFPHQLWLHVGSIFRPEVLVHPSEYDKDLNEVFTVQQLKAGVGADRVPQPLTLEEIQAAPKWDYTKFFDSGRATYWPTMISKQVPDSKFPVHWSIEKFTPLWQGEDFHITVAKGDKNLDEGLITSNLFDNPNTYWPAGQYQYLVHDVTKASEYGAPMPAESGEMTSGTEALPQYKWVDGLSNQAFLGHVAQGIDPYEATGSESATSEALKAVKRQYHWSYKAYILIEIGIGNPNHHYFIELVKGRTPRFLHLGEQWDHPDALSGSASGEISELDPSRYGYVKMCRVLSEYMRVTCNELFQRSDFRISVRNHLGKLVITFEGAEEDPWIIDRRDWVKGNDIKGEERQIPCVVPSGYMRIHGGNISCSVNFTPMTYIPVATEEFRDIQPDTGVARGEDINDSIYLTFAHMGNSKRFRNDSFRRSGTFSDSRWGPQETVPMGYTCDAKHVKEYHQNRQTNNIDLHRNFPKQYQQYGKGYTYEVARDSELSPLRDPDTGELILPEISDDAILNPHRLDIVNLEGEGQQFRENIAGTRLGEMFPDQAEFMSVWNAGVQFTAGDIKMPLPVGEYVDARASGLRTSEVTIDRDPTRNYGIRPIMHVLTPIATSWHMKIFGGGKVQGSPESRTSRGSFMMDVSPLVTNIKDGWSADGYSSINHEATLRCYLPIGPPIHDKAFGTQYGQLAQNLFSLHNKHFFVTIKYWWQDGVGRRNVNMTNGGANARRGIERRGPPDDLDSYHLCQMTGIATQSQFERTANRLFMTITVKDYTYILENQFIFNSPFFDGMDDVTVIWELAKLAGMDDDVEGDRFVTSPIDRRPLQAVRKGMTDRRDIGNSRYEYSHNGERIRCLRYTLPGTYASLAKPVWRFDNGNDFLSSMRKVAVKAGKCLYFDRFGILRFETIPAIEAVFSTSATPDHEVAFHFRTTPLDIGGADEGHATTTPFIFDPDSHMAHLVKGTVRWSRSVQDCVNQIVLLTATNEYERSDGTPIGGIGGTSHTFYKQIFYLDEEGFIGFKKPFYQSDGVFGSLTALRRTLRHYAKRKYPPYSVSFEAYGVPCLKALDIITVDDAYFYITEINHDIDMSKNSWEMTINAEWLKPYQDTMCFLDGTCLASEDDESEGS